MKDSKNNKPGEKLPQLTQIPWMEKFKEMPKDDDLITIEDAAKLLRRSKRTVYRLISLDHLPSTKIGGTRLFSKALILRLLYARMQNNFFSK